MVEGASETVSGKLRVHPSHASNAGTTVCAVIVDNSYVIPHQVR